MEPVTVPAGAPVRFLGTDASRTGTPRLQLSMLRWLAEHTAHPLQVVLDRGGPLAPAQADRATLRVVDSHRGRLGIDTAAAALDELGLGGTAHRVRLLQRRAAQRGLATPGMVWANGAAALRWLDLVPASVPVVAHIHELQTGIERSLAGLDPVQALRRPAVVVAVSSAVADHLVSSLGVDRERVVVHHGWLPDRAAHPPSAEPAATHPPSAHLAAIPPNALVVGGCGTIGWRKGASLFLILAQMVAIELVGRPIHWVWVGTGPPFEIDRLRREIGERGLSDRVHLVGEQPDPARWFARFDAFALTSREDPFPLVALEAGAAGVPVLGFRSGGVTELLGPDADDCIADPLDVEGLATLLSATLSDASRRHDLGRRLQARVLADHCADDSIPRLWRTISGEGPSA